MPVMVRQMVIRWSIQDKFSYLLSHTQEFVFFSHIISYFCIHFPHKTSGTLPYLYLVEKYLGFSLIRLMKLYDSCANYEAKLQVTSLLCLSTTKIYRMKIESKKFLSILRNIVLHYQEVEIAANRCFLI